MKKLSDNELRNILREKLFNYEAEVPDDVEQTIFTSIAQNKVPPSRKAKRISVMVALLVVSSIILYWSSPVRTNSLSASADKSDNALPNNIPNSSPEFRLEPGPAQPIPSSALLSIEEITNLDTISIDTGFSTTKKTFEGETIRIVKENNVRDTIVLSEIQQLHSPDTLVLKGEESSIDKPQGKFWVTFGIQPFLNYKKVRPIRGDGVELNDFAGPGSLNSNRLGFKFTLSADYKFANDKGLGVGFSYFQFNEVFQYTSSEQTHEIKPFNSIDELIQGVSISISGRYPLSRHLKGKQYISMSIDGQHLFGSESPSVNRFQAMVGLGYANEWTRNNRLIRVTPMINYSLKHYNYPGVRVKPFWLGIELAYSLKWKK